MVYVQFQQFLREASLFKTLERLDGRSFGVIATGNGDNDKLLRVATAKAGYDLLRIDGEVVEPAKEKGEDPTRTPETSFAVIAGAKTQPADLRKFLFHQTERFGQESFMFKPADKPKIFVVGVSENGWPGRHTAATLGEYTPGRFLNFLQKFKGDKYEYINLS